MPKLDGRRRVFALATLFFAASACGGSTTASPDGPSDTIVIDAGGDVGIDRGVDSLPADSLPADMLPADTLPADTLPADTLPDCPPTQKRCGGLCVDTDRDRSHCGFCNKTCDPGEVCSAGKCALSCQAQLVDCGGICTDPKTDRLHCGAAGDCTGSNSGDVCGVGAVCVNGSCQTQCPSGSSLCGGTCCSKTCCDDGTGNALCVDAANDPGHCGCVAGPPATAGATCSGGELCSGGSCSCPAGLTSCHGACTNTAFDPQNCGGCGNTPSVGAHRCASIETCLLGVCQPYLRWSTAQLIETQNNGPAVMPQIAIDANGNGIAVWAMANRIFSNRFDAATASWGTAQLIEGPGSYGGGGPQVAVDGNGHALAVWFQLNASGLGDVWVNRYDALTGSWLGAQLLETDSENARDPQISINVAGNAVAVWRQVTTLGRASIFAARYDAATKTWGAATLLETDDTGEALAPQVAVDASGNATAVWTQSDGTRYSVWSNRYDAATDSWGSPQLLETANTGHAYGPQVTTDGSGNAIAVWSQFDGPRESIWSNRYDVVTKSWGAPQLLETDNTGDANTAQVAADASGNAIAVWQQSDGTRTNIWFNRYDATTKIWAGAQLLESDNAGNASKPQVSLAPAGSAQVVWQQSDGLFHEDVWARRYDVTTGWGSAQVIETGTDFCNEPQVAINGSSKTISVWSQHDGVRFNIWSNDFR